MVHQKIKKSMAFLLSVCCISSTVLCMNPFTVSAADTSRFGEVLVSDKGTSPSIQNSNTSRKLAVASDGTIYAAYHCSEGIRVAKSADEGKTFQSSILAYDKDCEAEIAVSTDGSVYLAWVESGKIKLAKSTNGAASFSAPVNVGGAEAGSVHMATDGNYIYIIAADGMTLFRSTDSGSHFAAVTLSGTGYAFSDVHVDPTNHKVIVQEDKPDIRYYLSTNYGASFGGTSSEAHAYTPANQQVYYSVGSIGSDSTGHYLLIAGADFNGTHYHGVKINLDTGVATNPEMGANTVMQGRSLSDDIYGNMATGYSDGTNVYLMVSHDLGSTFGTPLTVAEDTTVSNASINTTNGDILFLYERRGKIYLKVYGGKLNGYSLNVSNSSLYFNADKNQDSEGVNVTNTSGKALAINSITVTGDFTIDRTTVGGSLSANHSATIHVNFKHSRLGTSSGNIDISYGKPALHKIITLTGYMSKQVASAPTVSQNPKDATVNVDEKATFSVTASSQGGGALSYQWQKSSDGITWVNITGAKSASYITGVSSSSGSGTRYRCVITNTKSGEIPASVTSSAATLTVSSGNTNPDSGENSPFDPRVVAFAAIAAATVMILLKRKHRSAQ